MILATKTLDAIDAALLRDNGATYRRNLRQVLPLFRDVFRDDDEAPHRPHLGASIVGRECARQIWFNFRWFSVPPTSARMIRLFNRGHLEEPRLIALLLTIGCQVWQQDANGRQFRISDHGGHYSGSGDGVIYGCPDVPGEYVLLEAKTHKGTSFSELLKLGVKKAKPEHFAQMQTYMVKMRLRLALYLAVNKDTDDIHAELVECVPEVGNYYSARALSIITSPTPPPRLPNASPGFKACKMCSFRLSCFGAQANTATNCRTCVHSRPDTVNGGWRCDNLRRELSEADQQQGCAQHTMFNLSGNQ